MNGRLMPANGQGRGAVKTFSRVLRCTRNSARTGEGVAMLVYYGVGQGMQKVALSHYFVPA